VRHVAAHIVVLLIALQAVAIAAVPVGVCCGFEWASGAPRLSCCDDMAPGATCPLHQQGRARWAGESRQHGQEHRGGEAPCRLTTCECELDAVLLPLTVLTGLAVGPAQDFAAPGGTLTGTPPIPSPLALARPPGIPPPRA